MEINKYFYHFSFKPQLLSQEREKMERKYKDAAADIIKKRGKMLLPKLLEILRSTPSESIVEFAQGLKKMEVLMLIYEDYPFPEETQETVKKINQILTTRYSVEVGKTAWTLFQHQFEDALLIDLLKQIYVVDGFGFLQIKDELLRHMETAVQHKDGIAQGLISMLLASNMRTTDAFHNLKIAKESKLEAFLMKRVLEDGLASDRLINRDGTDFIIRLLDNYSMDEYKSLIKIYLEPRRYKQFHTRIIQQAVERLRDPRERITDWTFLSESSVGEVKRWLIQRNLQVIFDNDQDNKRLNYWKRFIDYMEDVELIQDPMIAFIYFEKFVVVEYGQIGAAYFYHREGFDQIIHPISKSYSFRNSRSRATREGMFKLPNPTQRGIPLFIDKLDHRGRNWTDKFDNYMSFYLDGLF